MYSTFRKSEEQQAQEEKLCIKRENTQRQKPGWEKKAKHLTR